jgi:pimeloyl-ACP methyl ester carboxylesterase
MLLHPLAEQPCKAQNLWVADLHTEIYGTGDPVLLIHGSGSWGVDTFGTQQALADEFRLIMMDRRGYGQSPAAANIGWQTDKDDVAGLLTDLGSAHLVGHSSGGTVALLAAAMVPRAVRSLIVVEPTVWGIADPADSPPERPAAYLEVWVRGQGLPAKDFLIAITEVTGFQHAAGMVSATLARATEADWAAAEAMRHESWAGCAPIDVTALAATEFPKVVVVGGWDPALHPDIAGMWASGWHQAVAAEHSALARGINARLVTLGRSTHSPMIEEIDVFNALLRDTWRAAHSA